MDSQKEINVTIPIQSEPRNHKVKRLIIFWSRLVGWIGASCISPIVIFATKFGLFTKEEPTVDELGNVITSPPIKINGWGIISCIIVAWVIRSIVKEIALAYPTYNLAKQCLLGFTKTIIPLLCAYFVCWFLNGVISHVMFCILTLSICQCVAVPLNPLPKWRYEKSGTEQYDNFFMSFIKNIKQYSSKSNL